MLKSLKAGLLIGLAAYLFYRIENNFLSALCFSVGLLGIRIFGLSLFTGQIQLLPSKKISIKELLSTLYFNWIGVDCILILCWLCDENFLSSYSELCALKWSQPVLSYLLSGFCCGLLMTCATNHKTPLWISSLCVIAFILADFNHCIADVFYLQGNSGKWLLVLLGNICGGVFTATCRNGSIGRAIAS